MMKTIFHGQTREELISRIDSLSRDSKAQWGRMNVFQMVKHNTYWNGWILGTEKHTYKQALIGRVFGKLALRRMVRDEKPFDRNIPTSAQFKVEDADGDLDNEKVKWISLLKAYENHDNADFVHGFFGRMTREQIGILAYKHSDHHLRQFGS